MKQLSKEEVLDFVKTKPWETMTHEEIAHFQMEQNLLCVPFSVFHAAMEKSLGRPVWTHEFADRERLREELNGKVSPPSMEDIINMIPREKLVTVEVK